MYICVCMQVYPVCLCMYTRCLDSEGMYVETRAHRYVSTKETESKRVRKEFEEEERSLPIKPPLVFAFFGIVSIPILPGIIDMSEHATEAKRRIEDPSKANPSLNAFSSTYVITAATKCTYPSTSVPYTGREHRGTSGCISFHIQTYRAKLRIHPGIWKQTRVSGIDARSVDV